MQHIVGFAQSEVVPPAVQNAPCLRQHVWSASVEVPVSTELFPPLFNPVSSGERRCTQAYLSKRLEILDI